MISAIRSYLKAQILKVDSKLVQNNSAFYDNDIGETRIEKSYQIEINNIVNQTRNNVIENTMDIVISIFGYGYRNEVDNYDELLSKAICIRDLQNFSQVETITNIIANDVAAVTLPSDDNGFKIDINLTLTQAYLRG